MTDDERNELADRLFALVFSLRPTQTVEAGQAWVLQACSTAMARAILASTGPQEDATDLCELAHAQVTKIVTETQAKFYRDRLSIAGDAKVRSIVQES